MIRAILDTNVLVQSLIGPSSTSAGALDAYFDACFIMVVSPAVLDEWLEVLTLSKIRDRHGLSDDEIIDFVASLLAFGERFAGDSKVSPALTRDVTDTKFLSLALESSADFLVTNDHRHLLPLKKFGTTRIVTPAAFLREIS